MYKIDRKCMHHYMKQVSVYTKLITVARIIMQSMLVCVQD